jgi:hypothetical protein
MKNVIRTLVACFCLVLAPLAARAQNYSDIWWNSAESGWGLTIADHQSNLFAVWFTYRQDGKPTWYVIPGGTFTNNHTHFVGDIYTTTGPAFSNASFDASRVTATKVGTATLDFSSFTAGTFTFAVSGVTQTKTIQRQPFGNATPLWGRDVTDIWYNPSESGWGLTLAQHGNNVFGVWFTYDTDGQPLWAVMPGVTFNGTTAFTGALYTTTGPAFSSAPFDSSRVTVKQDGTATITVSKAGAAGGQCGSANTATFQTSLRGASRQSTICQQAFGDLAAVPDFPDMPALANPAAFFAAPANPLDAAIATDGSTAVSQLVTTAGGTITTTDAKGNKFTLDIPPKALMNDTAIRMTPVATVAGPKYASGVALGLKLEPDGLVLLQNAILTVEPATPIPLESQTGFSADGDGKDLHRAPPGPDFTRMQLHVSHFSFWGWLWMTAAERAAEARMAQAAKDEARIEQEIADNLNGVKQVVITGARDSLDPPPSKKDIQGLLDEYYQKAVLPRIASAQQGCGFAGEAFDSLMKFVRQNAIIGGADIPDFVTNIDTLRVAFGKLKDKTPCYFTEEATYTALQGIDTIKVTVKAYWRAVSQAELVVTYKAQRGSMHIEWKPPKGCAFRNPDHGIDEGQANSQLNIDWNARSYEGAGGSVPVMTATCTPPPDVNVTFPVFYLGDLNNPPAGMVKGPIKAGNGIGPETHDFGFAQLSYTFTTNCSGDDLLFCGITQTFPE